jgi:hypothetical protein
MGSSTSSSCGRMMQQQTCGHFLIMDRNVVEMDKSKQKKKWMMKKTKVRSSTNGTKKKTYQ